MKKILYSILGGVGGHVASAQAIIAAMDKLHIGPFEHKLIDLHLELKSYLAKIAFSYKTINEHLPWLWKALYYSTNDPKRVDKLYDFFYPWLYKRKMLEILKKENPDLIVSMVGPPTRGLVRATNDFGKPIPLLTVVLDPISVHAAWVDPRVDCQIVATEEAKETCIKFGMPVGKIKVLGFPVNPCFLQASGTKEEIRKHFDLDPALFTVLIMGGGAGIGKVFNIVKALNLSDLNIQLMVVAGHNKKLELKLRQSHFRFPAKIFGFTDKIPEIMSGSDVIITKAGPGAVFEAIAKELPLILTGCIPGQEEGNINYALKNKIGMIADKPKKIIEAIRKMQTAGTEEIKSNIRRIQCPAAVYDIAKLIANYLNSN